MADAITDPGAVAATDILVDEDLKVAIAEQMDGLDGEGGAAVGVLVEEVVRDTEYTVGDVLLALWNMKANGEVYSPSDVGFRVYDDALLEEGSA